MPDPSTGRNYAISGTIFHFTEELVYSAYEGEQLDLPWWVLDVPAVTRFSLDSDTTIFMRRTKHYNVATRMRLWEGCVVCHGLAATCDTWLPDL